MAEIKPNFTGRPGGAGGMGGPHGHHFAQKEKPRNTKTTVRRIAAYLGPGKKMLIGGFFLSLLSAVMTVAVTRLNGYAVDRCIGEKSVSALAAVCITLIGLYIIAVVSSYLQNILMIRLAQQTSARIRSDLFGSVQKLPLAWFDTHPAGDLMSRLTNDVDNVNMMLAQGVVQLFSGIVLITLMLAAMIMLSPLLTFIALCCVPLFFITTKIIVSMTQKWFRSQQKELGRLNSYIEEMISAQKTVTLFGREHDAEKSFEKINTAYTASAVPAQGLSGILGPLNNTVNNILYLVLAVSGSLLIINGFPVTVGIVFSFLLYMKNFTRPINDILNLFNTVQSALAGAERVFDILDTPKESDSPGAHDVSSIEGNAELHDVVFSYILGKPVLRGINISVRAGQTAAIVGHTGAGKTTIINVLAGLYSIDSGSILIDGCDIRSFTAKSLRSSISVVLQDPFLFTQTVRENIRYGRPSATDEQVYEAARKAGCDDFIRRLANGYDTVLSDNGSNLSKGECQLLSIARAVIAESSILILDEATSSVDTRTELRIQEALLALMRGKTSFVIAHRLSTIRNADIIIFIENGIAAEQGTHEQLLASGGLYAQMYRSQFATGLSG